MFVVQWINDRFTLNINLPLSINFWGSVATNISLECHRNDHGWLWITMPWQHPVPACTEWLFQRGKEQIPI